MEAIRAELGVEKLTLFGISYGTELAIAYARAFPDHVERLILDSVVDPDDADPFLTADFRAMTPSLQSLCPARCRGHHADPGADLAELVARCAPKPMRRAPTTQRAARTASRSGRSTLFDLMFHTDYLPPLRARSSRSRSAPRWPATARRSRGSCATSTAFDDLGSPRDFSTARYSTVCETTPLPWDPGTPLDQRARGRAAADRGAAGRTPSRRSTRRRRRGRDRPLPALAGRPAAAVAAAPLPYPTVPTLILQGGEDLRTPPEVSARVAARIPGAEPARRPRRRPLDGQRPAHLLRRAAILRFVDGGAAEVPCRRVPTGVPAVLRRPASFDVAARLRRPAAQGRPHACARSRRRSTTCGSCSRRRRWRSSGGGLRGGTWSIGGNRLVLRATQAVNGRDT